MQPGPHGSSFYLPFCQYLKSRIYLSSNYKTPNLAAELCQWTIIHMYKLVSSQIHRLSILPLCSSLVLFCSLQFQIFSCLLRLSRPSPLLSLHRWFPATPLTSVTVAPPVISTALLVTKGKYGKSAPSGVQGWPLLCSVCVFYWNLDLPIILCLLPTQPFDFLDLILKKQSGKCINISVPKCL